MNVEVPPSGNNLLNAYLMRTINSIKNAIDSLKTVLVSSAIKNPSLGRFYLVTTPSTQFANKGLYYYNGQEFVQLAEGSTTELELGILHTQAFFGDLGQEAYLHTQNTNNPHAVTAEQIGLDKVDNTADMDKPISTATFLELNKYVLKTITVNGKPLSSNIVLTTVDVAPTANRRYLTFAEYTLATTAADATHDGYLKATDWVAFNAKEDSINKTITIAGNEASNVKFPTVKAMYDWAIGLFIQKNTPITGATKTKITYDSKGLVIFGSYASTSDIIEDSSLYFTEPRVRDTALAGLAVSAGTLSATDTILQAFNKIAGLIDNDGWVAYTPTLTNITIGNGTNVAYYKKIGKTVHFYGSVTFGSTSSMGTTPTISLPFTISSNVKPGTPIGTARLQDASGLSYPSIFTSGGIIPMLRASDAVWVSITSTVPFTWATNDFISYAGTFEST